MPSILPGGAIKCLLRKNVTADQLAAAGLLQLNFPVTVTPAGTAPNVQITPATPYAASLATLIGASPACGVCRSCLEATRTFAQAQPETASPVARASAFATFCGQSEALKQSQLCSKVQADIAASTFGNLGRRAAGLCFALELCDRKLGTSCSMAVAANASSSPAPVSTATLDTCTGKRKQLATMPLHTDVYTLQVECCRDVCGGGCCSDCIT